MLACKPVNPKNRLVIGQAIDRIAHLQQVEHTHVIRLMGPYVMVRDISILVYSLADCHLDAFHEQLQETSSTDSVWDEQMVSSRAHFNKFLAHVVRYLHSKCLKHLAIKATKLPCPKALQVTDSPTDNTRSTSPILEPHNHTTSMIRQTWMALHHY